MQLIDTSGILQNTLNSRLTAMLVARLYAQTGTSGVAIPDSTRRGFLSGMRADSRVALQGAQNMKDAAAMVTVAQSDVTAIKDKLNEMMEKLIEAATLDPMEDPDYATTNSALLKLSSDIADIAKNSQFNGIRLLDGSAGMNEDGVIQLQGGNAALDQPMVNMLDDSVVPWQVLGNDGEINLNNLGLLFDYGAWYVMDQESAATARDELQKVIDRVEGIEAQYSNDIKGLNNMSLLLQHQADIFEGVWKVHYGTLWNEDGSEQNSTSSAASSSVADLLGGNIMLAVS